MTAVVREYLGMIKFGHTVFALPFALLAAVLASHREGGWRPLDLVGVVLCMVFARTSAMGFNRWADRALDAANPRTRSRSIPAGRLSAAAVLALTLLSGGLFVAATGLFVVSSGNAWPLLLSGPVLAWLLGYSLAKRFTPLAHLWLGVALALSPVAAWVAIRPVPEWPPLLLAAAVASWVTGFDILYACQDAEVDRRLGLHSIPARLGIGRAMHVARLLHLTTVVLLVAFGRVTPELGAFWWLGLAAVAVLLAAEHWLVRGRDLLRINLAFFQVNGVVSATLLLATLLDVYLPLA